MNRAVQATWEQCLRLRDLLKFAAELERVAQRVMAIDQLDAEHYGRRPSIMTH